jgi:hypothetical protein
LTKIENGREREIDRYEERERDSDKRLEIDRKGRERVREREIGLKIEKMRGKLRGRERD